MPIVSGKYYIFSVGSHRAVHLKELYENAPLELLSDFDQEQGKWLVQRMNDGSYIITNAAAKNFNAYAAKVEQGELVVANNAKIQWSIVGDTSNSFRISSAGLSWQANGNFITLQPSSNTSNDGGELWTFRAVS